MEKTIITFSGEVAQIFNDSNCGSTRVATTIPIDVATNSYFGIWLKCGSAGTVNVEITYEASYSQLTGDFATPEGVGVLLPIVDTNVHAIAVAPIPMKYIRFKATGVGSNDGSTVITGYIFTQ